MFSIDSYYQLHHLDFTYLFRMEGEEGPFLNLKIFDVYNKCVFNKTFSHSQLDVLDVRQVFGSGDYALQKLSEKNLLSKELLSQKPKCVKILKEVIKFAKENLLDISSDDFKGFVCSITGKGLVDPVVDNNGDLFERKALDEYLKNNRYSPLDHGKRITGYNPFLILKEKLKKVRDRSIPTFSNFKFENDGLFKRYMELASVYTGKRKYNEAISCFSKAFQYTKDWRCYNAVVNFFNSIGRETECICAELYFAKYQFENGEIDEQVFETINKLQSVCNNDDLLSKCEKLLKNIHKLRLISSSDCKEFYEIMQSELNKNQSLEQRFSILMKGACLALDSKNDEFLDVFKTEIDKLKLSDSFFKDLFHLSFLHEMEEGEKLGEALANFIFKYRDGGEKSNPIYAEFVRGYRLAPKIETPPVTSRLNKRSSGCCSKFNKCFIFLVGIIVVLFARYIVQKKIL